MCGRAAALFTLSSPTAPRRRSRFPALGVVGGWVADQPIAIIDVGSNSGRVVVLQMDAAHHLQVLSGARVPLRLAASIDDAGNLSDDAIERTVAAVRDFQRIAQRAGSVRIVAVATSAVRDAANGDE